ncbi:MAG: hypothetical protein HPY79_11555 [Bacteroidales bacterium]|nr:hypothetical protein [Bacteroidales bacterium]
MKKIFTIAILVLAVNAWGQTLKTFNGPFNDGKLPGGTAVYTYYIDSKTNEPVKHGQFKYTLIGSGKYKGYDQTITGDFENGLRNGTWSYKITMTDFGNSNPYFTGTVTLIANYKNGYANGNWKEVRSYKQRNKTYNGWGPFDPVKTLAIDLNFDNGYLVGSVFINDEFKNFKATGSFDKNSYYTGNWIVNNAGWGKFSDITYKDLTIYDNEEKYNKYMDVRKMTVSEREEAGFRIDTACGANEIKDYFPKLFSVDYFLYNFIEGDLSFKEGFKGGCYLYLYTTSYKPLASNTSFIQAESFYERKDYLNAYQSYSAINLNELKPSEANIITSKIMELTPFIESLFSLNEKLPSILDSISNDRKQKKNDFNELTNTFNQKYIREDIGYYANYYLTTPFGEKILANGDDLNIDKPCCLYPWQLSSSQAMKCFKSNPKIFTLGQIKLTETFFKYYDIPLPYNINYTNIKYNNSWHSIKIFDYNGLCDTLKNSYNEYLKAQELYKIETVFFNKIKEVESKNDENKKKVLFSKYLIVLDDLKNNYYSTTTIDGGIIFINSANQFLDKVLSLYTVDTKDLEKQLKSAETVEQIKSIILK